MKIRETLGEIEKNPKKMFLTERESSDFIKEMVCLKKNHDVEKMKISTTKIKQYGSTYKHLLIVGGVPVCIVKGVESLNDCISYLTTGKPKLKDNRIMKILDKVKRGKEK